MRVLEITDFNPPASLEELSEMQGAKENPFSTGRATRRPDVIIGSNPVDITPQGLRDEGVIYTAAEDAGQVAVVRDPSHGLLPAFGKRTKVDWVFIESEAGYSEPNGTSVQLLGPGERMFLDMFLPDNNLVIHSIVKVRDDRRGNTAQPKSAPSRNQQLIPTRS